MTPNLFYYSCLVLTFVMLLSCSFSEMSFIQINLKAKSSGSLRGRKPNPSAQNCKDYYPRLFYTSQPHKMLIKFNTMSACNRSYVTIMQNYSISKFYCVSSTLKIEQKTLFQRYIQDCFVTIKTNYPDFNYTVYGQSGNMSRQKLYFQQLHEVKNPDYFQVRIPQPHQKFNLIVIADWGPMKVRTYQSVYPSLVNRIANSELIHGLLIIGDVAYNLDSDQCKQYQLFMDQLAAVSPYFPIIPVLGNHETFSYNNLQIFRKTFACYNLTSDQRVQAYNFWNFKIVAFDPFYQIYNISTKEKYQKMRSALLSELDPQINKDKFVILTSHYPVICSQDVFHCRQTLKSLPQLYLQISQLHQVDLYLGAHMHQYERIVPYLDGKFMTDMKNLKRLSKGLMPSIVEGVAGCDVGIISDEYPVQDFSVAHTYNKTGYGILTVDNIQKKPSAVYKHYLTISEKQTVSFDQIEIDTDNNEMQ